MYANVNKDTIYNETENIEISNPNVEKIELILAEDKFVADNGSKY